MSQTDLGGQPPTATAGSVSATPAAAPAPASSSTVQDDFSSRIKSAPNSPLALRGLIDQMKATTPKPGSKPATHAPTPAPESTAAPEEATPEATPTTEAAAPEAGEATPAPEATTEQAAPAQEPTAEPENEDDGGEGPVTPLTGKRAHIRVPEGDEVGRLALAFQKRNRDWTLSQALDAANKQLGITPQKQEAAQEPAPTGPQLPKSIQETESAYEQTMADYRKAMSEVRFEDAADLNAKLMQLTSHRSTLERRAEQQEVQKEQTYSDGFKSSSAKASELYPFAADATSAGAKRMMEIDAELKANDDPLYYSPNRPLKIAQMVAAELNIAPKKKGQPAPATAAAPAPAAPKKGIVPSGSNRTVPPAPKPAVDPKISGIKTMTDFRAQMREMKVPGY